MPATLDHWKVLPHGALVEMDDGILTVAGDIPLSRGSSAHSAGCA